MANSKAMYKFVRCRKCWTLLGGDVQFSNEEKSGGGHVKFQGTSCNLVLREATDGKTFTASAFCKKCFDAMYPRCCICDEVVRVNEDGVLEEPDKKYAYHLACRSNMQIIPFTSPVISYTFGEI